MWSANTMHSWQLVSTSCWYLIATEMKETNNSCFGCSGLAQKPFSQTPCERIFHVATDQESCLQTLLFCRQAETNCVFNGYYVITFPLDWPNCARMSRVWNKDTIFGKKWASVRRCKPFRFFFSSRANCNAYHTFAFKT